MRRIAEAGIGTPNTNLEHNKQNTNRIKPFRLSSHGEAVPHPHQAHPITSEPIHTTQKSATTSTGKAASAEKRVPMEHMLAGLTVFVIIAGLVHWILKARRRRRAPPGVRGFRKGESLIEDEDDLLISQMYT